MGNPATGGAGARGDRAGREAGAPRAEATGGGPAKNRPRRREAGPRKGRRVTLRLLLPLGRLLRGGRGGELLEQLDEREAEAGQYVAAVEGAVGRNRGLLVRRGVCFGRASLRI